MDGADSGDAVFPLCAVAAALHALRHRDQSCSPTCRSAWRSRWSATGSRRRSDSPWAPLAARCCPFAWRARRCSCQRATPVRSTCYRIRPEPRSARLSQSYSIASLDYAMTCAPGAVASSWRGAVAIWVLRCSASGLLAQVNPGIPLFAATFDPSLELTSDVAGTLIAGGAKRIQRGRRRSLPGVARPAAPISRLGSAPADRFRAGAQGQRREPAAAAGRARNMAQAWRIPRHHRRRHRVAGRHLAAATDAHDAVRDRAAVLAGRAVACARHVASARTDRPVRLALRTAAQLQSPDACRARRLAGARERLSAVARRATRMGPHDVCAG